MQAVCGVDCHTFSAALKNTACIPTAHCLLQAPIVNSLQESLAGKMAQLYGAATCCPRFKPPQTAQNRVLRYATATAGACSEPGSQCGVHACAEN